MSLTITIPGAVDVTTGSTAPAVLTIGVGVPGAQGPQGPAGQGVPAGGTSGQFLQKTSGTDYATDWVTVNPFITAVTSPLSVTSGNLSVNLSSYLTTSAAASTYYLQTNPAGYITSSALVPYLLSSTAASTYQPISGMSSYLTTSAAASTYAVTARGLPAAGTTGQVLTKNSGSDYDVSFATLIPGDRYLTTSTTSNTIGNGTKTFTVGTGLSYSSQQDVVISFDASNHMHALVTSYNSGTGVLVVEVQHHTGSGTYSVWTVNVGGTTPQASIVWGDITGTLGNQTDLSTALNAKLDSTTAASTYFTITAAAGKANLSGATFTGKVNFTPVAGASGLNVGIGGTSTSSTTNGDLWITTGGTNLNFRDGTGSWRILVNTSNTNTFSAPQIIDTTSATTALRVTQKGTGDAIRVEDETTPDATRFTVDQFGKVGIGVAPDGTAALKVDTNGIMFGDGTVQTTAAAPFVYDGTFQKASLTDGSSFSVQISPTRVDLLPDIGGTSLTAGGITFPDNTTQTTAAVPGIPDAPSDGYFYVRQNGNWSSPFTMSLINVDGNSYYVLSLANP